MTSRFKIPSGPERQTAEAAFDALLKLEVLRRPGAGGERSTRPVSLSRLYDYAVNAGRGDDAEVERALEQSPGLAADLRLLLEKTALRHVPRAAAAAAGPVRERHGDGCRVRLQPSRAEPGQVYVIIEMAPVAESAEAPRALFVCDSENRCQRHALPEPRDGVIQLLAEAQSDLVRALQDIKTEIYLR